MNIDLPYGRGSKSVRIPDDISVDFMIPPDDSAVEDIEETLERVVRKPAGSPPLDELLHPGEGVVILVSDLTRDAGTVTLLLSFVGYLKRLGLKPADIRIIVARGTHRHLTKEERQLFRKGELQGTRLEEHDCDNLAGMEALVLTTRGTPVRVNRALKESDHVVLLAPISFHYFAGFGGGRKLILPGCTDRQSILANHRLSLLDSKPVRLNPQCGAGVLDGNPVHEDMCEALDALENVFAINFFSDTKGGIAFINAGSPKISHVEACEAFRKRFTVHAKAPCDILLLSPGGMPYDVNLLQSHKALRSGSRAVKKGGTVLFFAECGEGVGSDSLEAALKIPADLFLKEAYREYMLNNQAAVSLHYLTNDLTVSMITALPEEWMKRCGLNVCMNAEACVADALSRHPSASIAVMPFGAKTLPIFDEEAGR
jgi:nickel-dependent lactate racemase